MKIKKMIGWILGGFCLGSIILGISVLLFPQLYAVISGIVLICLSLASGMLVPNPISFIALIVGILMLFIPHMASGIMLIVLGLIGALINLLVMLKITKK